MLTAEIFPKGRGLESLEDAGYLILTLFQFFLWDFFDSRVPAQICGWLGGGYAGRSFGARGGVGV